MAMTLLALPSCKSLDTTTLHHTTQHYTTLHNSVDTVVVRDSVIRHDSVIYRERTIRDTVYITKEVYRDTHNSSLIAHNSTQADTVRVVEYRDRVIEHPPERYIPPFYKHCTTILFIIFAAGIVYLVIRWRLHL
jgi:hypothetical protein